jgi:penicillin-binding protein 2
MIAQCTPMTKKIIVLFSFITLSFLLIIARLIQLQVLNEYIMSKRAKQNFLRLQSIPSYRGEILDCKKRLIATNKVIYHLYWHGSGNKVLTSSQLKDIEKINVLLEKAPFDVKKLYSLQRSEILQKKEILCANLSHKEVCMIIESFAIHKNIVVETTLERHYPYQTYASHLIGYIGNTQNTYEGKMGIEKLCENSLKGVDGSYLYAINSFGKHIDQMLIQQPLIGSQITTTLDMELQEIAESIFPPDLIGALIIMDPENGAIRALASRPTFDPGLFLSKISYRQWDLLQENNTFLNRAFMPFPPGSIFKLITTSAALEKNIVHQDDTWYCKGYTTFGNRKYYCARKRGHGHLSLKQAVAHSCNTLFFEIGKKLDIDVLADYAHRFGLGRSTGISLQEQYGLVPTRQWKRITKGQPWWPGETLSAVIGQTFLLASPLQIACLIGSIFTKKLITPRILEDEQIHSVPLNIKQETLIFLKKSMKSVVRRGTGKQIPTIQDINIFAKTSTAQISSLEKAAHNKALSEHGWFAAYFTYKDTNPLVFVLLVENAGSSRIPTTIAKQFFLKYKKCMSLKEPAAQNLF